MFINRMSMFHRSLFNKPVESNFMVRTNELELQAKEENVRDRKNEKDSKFQEQTQKLPGVAKAVQLTPSDWKNLIGVQDSAAAKSGPSNGKVTVNGSTARYQSAEKWAEMGVDKTLLDKFFTEVKLNAASESEQEYGLRNPYKSMTMTAQGGSLNSGSWKQYTLTLDSKDNSKHTQTVKYYSDGRMETVDNVTTNYSQELSNGFKSLFTQKQLKSLGINDDMIAKYFQNNKYGDYTLKKPYTSFDVTQMSGDTTQGSKIVFKRGDRIAGSDTYVDGKTKFPSDMLKQTIEKKRI